MRMAITSAVPGVLALGLCAGAGVAQGKVDFGRQVLPILKKSCFRCHQATYKDSRGRTRKPKSRLRLDGKGWILKGGKNGLSVVPGKPDESPLYQLVRLDPGDEDIMPAKGDPLTARQTDLIRRWIAEGCVFGGWTGKAGPGAAAVAAARDKARPKALTTSRMKVIGQLAAGMKPALPQAVEKASGRKCQVVPVVPDSPLLRVAFVSNEGTVFDEELQGLVPLADHITHLSLAKTRITDESLRSVGRMKNLTHLDLNRTEITDAGLRRLTDLSELRYLNLHSTAVTDEGLVALGTLANLEALYLWNSKVTEDGVRDLGAKLPRTKISYMMDIPQVDPDARNNNRRRRRR